MKTPVASALLLSALFIGASNALATEALRVAIYNVQSLNLATQGYTDMLAIIKRMDADVIMLEEVTGNAEVAAVPALATAAGYPFSVVATAQGTLTGDLHDAILSRYPIVSSKSWSAAQISGDPTANDITRDILEAQVSVPNVCGNIGFFSVHLKSGSTSTDDFRRAIELRRVKKVIENFLATNPTSQVFFGGDLNDDVNDGPFGATFNALPSGLPASFDLGNDMTFPVVYDPFNYIASIGGLSLTMADTTSEDCTTCYATRVSSGRRLDYLFARASTIDLGDEIYASPSDNGIDDAPSGNYLDKAFAPLLAGASNSAADHYSVFVDYLLNSCDGSRFGSAYPGTHLLTPRAGIKGNAKIGDATFGLRLVYGRPSSSAVLVLGSQKLAPPSGFPLAPYVPGANLYVDVISAYGIFVTATDAKGDSTFPLPLPNSATLLGLKFESQWFVSDAGAPNAIGAMSDAYEVIVHG